MHHTSFSQNPLLMPLFIRHSHSIQKGHRSDISQSLKVGVNPPPGIAKHNEFSGEFIFRGFKFRQAAQKSAKTSL
jgi:hypothetical protein